MSGSFLMVRCSLCIWTRMLSDDAAASLVPPSGGQDVIGPTIGYVNFGHEVNVIPAKVIFPMKLISVLLINERCFETVLPHKLFPNSFSIPADSLCINNYCDS